MTDFVNAVKSAYKNYANFKGRASRSDYWWVALFFMVVVFGLSILSTLLGRAIGGLVSLVMIIFYIGSLLPMISLAARRMHDNDKSGWFMLIPIYSFYLAVIKGTDGPNRFGPDPLGGTGDTFN